MANEGVANRFDLQPPNPGAISGINSVLVPEMAARREDARKRANALLEGMIGGNVIPQQNAPQSSIGQKFIQNLTGGPTNQQLPSQYTFLQNPQRMLMRSLFGGGNEQLNPSGQPATGQPSTNSQPSSGGVVAAFKPEDALAKIPESERGNYRAVAKNTDLMGIPVTTFTAELKPEFQEQAKGAATGETTERQRASLQAERDALEKNIEFLKGSLPINSAFRSNANKQQISKLQARLDVIDQQLQSASPFATTEFGTTAPEGSVSTTPNNDVNARYKRYLQIVGGGK